ncbi:MAG TPA: DUF6620 family protein [Nannocystaceae bacterium]|nr:DUF6620 family protein [Nannocystaceae bacterium]
MGLFDSLRNKLAGAAAPEPEPEDVVEVEADEAETRDEDDDGPPRDYAMEAIDDPASFDFHADLRPYFRFELQVEMHWEDKARRHQLFREHGIRDEQHFRQVQATAQRYMQSPAAAAKYGDYGDIMQIKGDCSMDMHMQQMAARQTGELASEFAAVEGVELDAWAHVQAKLAGGGDLDALIAQIGVDRAKWDRVSAEWMARMSRDTTGTVATAYGRAFSSGGTGQFAGAGAQGAAAMSAGGSVDPDQMPMPLERYVEIEQAQGAAGEQGGDAIAVLKSFGLSIVDWSNVSQWFSQYFARNMNKNGQALYHEYTALQEKYAAKYRVAKADADISF